MHAELGLGKLIDGEAHRDAIHVAVAPVVAGEPLPPGTHVGFIADGRVGCTTDPIGIVDPFLKVRCVLPDQRFWLFLYPNTVTGMRHHWQHPEFGESKEPPKDATAVDVSAPVKWLTDFAAQMDRDYAELMQDAKNYLEHGDYVTQYDDESWRDNFYEVSDVFWDHYERVTGTKVSADDRGSPYSCSC